MLNKAVK